MASPLKIAGVGHGHHDCEWHGVPVQYPAPRVPNHIPCPMSSLPRSCVERVPISPVCLVCDRSRTTVPFWVRAVISYCSPGLETPLSSFPQDLWSSRYTRPRVVMCAWPLMILNIAGNSGGLRATSLSLHATATPERHASTTSFVVDEPPAASTPPLKRPKAAELVLGAADPAPLRSTRGQRWR